MNLPAVYALLNKPDIIALTGKPEIPLYYISDVPQSPKGTYIVWSVPSGIEPNEYLASPSDADRFGVQIDVYSNSAITSSNIAGLIRKHLFMKGEVNFLDLSYEQETGLNRAIIDVSLFVNNSWEL